MDLMEVFNLVYAAATVLGAAGAYFAFRGRRFGLTDFLVFGPLAGCAVAAAIWLYRIAASGHGESSAYAGLVALLGLLALIPVAAGLCVVAGVAATVSFVRYRTFRYATFGAVAIAWLVHWSMGNMTDFQAPGGALNGDRLAGENWALESGAATKIDCDRQSSAKAFREGCYSRAGK